MGSHDWLSSGSALGALASRLRTLQRLLLSQRPAVRWAAAGSALALIFLLGYLGSASPAERGSYYLHSGRRYTPEDLSKIGRTLDKQRIPYNVDEDRRVSVSRAKFDQAEEIVAKMDLGPRLPGEFRDQASESSPWESPHDKERRELHVRAKTLQVLINDLPGIVDSFVSITRPKARLSLQPAGKPTAFVRLETEEDRQLPFRTVQSITTILTGYEEGLSADTITVVDRRGHRYLVAGNPELNALSSTRAREEELSQQILQELDWIKGVRVSVQLPTGVADHARPIVATPSTPGREVEPSPEPKQDAVASKRESPSPVVALNRGLSLDIETIESATDESVRTPAPPAAHGLAGAPGATPEPPSAHREPGRVWVRVPRSYYYQVSVLPGHKEPTRDDLMKLVARLEEQIKTGVGLIVPLSGPSAWKATVDIIQDDTPLADSQAATAPLENRRPILAWGIAGALGALAATLVAAASWALHARRPAGRGDSPSRRLRYDVATADSPGPSERVREFVRRNPEAAVSVLERWTSQGGIPG